MVEASFETTSKPWVMKLLKDSAPKDYLVTGKFTVSGTPKNMRIQELKVETNDPKRLFVEACGIVKQTGKTYGYEGDISAGAARALLGVDDAAFAEHIAP